MSFVFKFVFHLNSHLGNGRPASIAALGGRGTSQSMIDVSSMGRGNHVHSMIDGHAPSMMGTHMSHMEPMTSSFHMARTDMYNGNYPHLQVGEASINSTSGCRFAARR